MSTARGFLCVLVLASGWLAAPRPARAETTLQLWTNFMAEWQVSERHFLAFDLEPKVLLIGQGQWTTTDFTPTYEFAPVRWLDLIAEAVFGYTHDTLHPDNVEVTERLGARVYFWRSRLQLRDTFRLEQRNRFFSDDTRDAVFRSRNRVELDYVFNREHSSELGAWIGIFDYEYFIPFDRNTPERYASRHRVRSGIGYRPAKDWRVDLIYLWQRSRNTIGQHFDNADHVIDLRLRRAF